MSIDAPTPTLAGSLVSWMGIEGTVGKKTVRMFVIIQIFLNNSRTIKAMDLKFLGHTVVYVV